MLLRYGSYQLWMSAESQKVSYRWILLQNLAPIFEEIFVECLVLGMVCLQHSSIKAGDLFGFRRKIYFLA